MKKTDNDMAMYLSINDIPNEEIVEFLSRTLTQEEVDDMCDDLIESYSKKEKRMSYAEKLLTLSEMLQTINDLKSNYKVDNYLKICSDTYNSLRCEMKNANKDVRQSTKADITSRLRVNSRTLANACQL